MWDKHLNSLFMSILSLLNLWKERKYMHSWVLSNCAQLDYFRLILHHELYEDKCVFCCQILQTTKGCYSKNENSQIWFLTLPPIIPYRFWGWRQQFWRLDALESIFDKPKFCYLQFCCNNLYVSLEWCLICFWSYAKNQPS